MCKLNTYTVMKILLACAKLMQTNTESSFTTSIKSSIPNAEQSTKTVSVPYFLKHANEIALELCKWTTEELSARLKCNMAIAAENKQRFMSFQDRDQLQPTVLTYNGQAYKGLQAGNMSQKDLEFAQQHLLITSFLYGLLRPLDLIHPYRMEGTVKLEYTQNNTLFHFWKDKLTDWFIQEVQAAGGILVHLATEEMEHLFHWKKVQQELQIIQPRFLVEKNGKAKVVTVYAKMCRGAMARHIIKNRIVAPDELLTFLYDGFTYDKLMSKENEPCFVLR